MTRGVERDLLSEAAVLRTRGHPRMRAAAEAFAAEALAEHDAQDPPTRWLLSDLGRASLYWGAVILDATPDGLTPAGLVAVSRARGVTSRGRAIAFLQYAETRGFLAGAPEPLPWLRRRLSPTPAFYAPLRRRIRGGVEAAALVAPEAAEALPRLQSDAGAQAAITSAALLTAAHPRLSANPGGALREVFIARDAGMRILHDLLLSQAPDRGRLLEATALSRAQLARRHGVSRTHVNRLLNEAQAAGAVSLAAPDRIVFAPAFSDEVEAYYAGLIQIMRVVAATLVATSDLSAA